MTHTPRSRTTAFVVTALEYRGEGTASEFDVEAIVNHILIHDIDLDTITGPEFAEIAALHQL